VGTRPPPDGEPVIDPSDVQVAVVAFNPGEALQPLCAVLIAAGCRVLVVDNASESGLDVLERCRSAGAVVVRSEENAGVSGALALALEYAHGGRWLLTFDQDSVIEPAFLSKLFATSAVRDRAVAMIGPHVVDAASGDLLQGHLGSTHPYDARLIITSGALCRISALDDVGGFSEDLFIDHVDHDVCLRLRGRGWRIAIEPAAVMRHSIGQMQTHVVAGLGIRNSHHGADRQYYKYRNFLLLIGRGTARQDLPWAFRTLLALTWAPLKLVVFEDNRAAKLKAIAAGIRDGLLGRSGRRQ
jgi:rhamnosyltransferase